MGQGPLIISFGVYMRAHMSGVAAARGDRSSLAALFCGAPLYGGNTGHTHTHVHTQSYDQGRLAPELLHHLLSFVIYRTLRLISTNRNT